MVDISEIGHCNDLTANYFKMSHVLVNNPLISMPAALFGGI